MNEKFPKVCLNVLVIKDNKILLGLLNKNWLHNGKQVYGFPGRDLLFKETFGEAVERDLKEELGVEVTSHKVIAVNANFEYGNHYVEVGIQAEIKGEVKLLKPEDWESWVWFDIDKIPDNLFPSARTLIKCYKENKVTVSE